MEQLVSQEENPDANQNDEQDLEEIEGEVTPLLDDDDSDSKVEEDNDDKPSCRRNKQFQPHRSSQLHCVNLR